MCGCPPLTPRHDDSVILTYRLSKFRPGDAVIDIIARIPVSSSSAHSPRTIRSSCRQGSSCAKYAHAGREPARP